MKEYNLTNMVGVKMSVERNYLEKNMKELWWSYKICHVIVHINVSLFYMIGFLIVPNLYAKYTQDCIFFSCSIQG